MADEPKGDEGELQGNSEFLPFQKADNDDDVPDTVEVVALDAEPTVAEAQPTIAETLTATARAAYATASSLVDTLQQFDEAKAFLLDRIPESIRALGKDHANTLRLQRMYAQCLYQNDGTSREDVTAAIAALEDIDEQTRTTIAARLRAARSDDKAADHN